jgi:hypothetical protein
MRVYVAICIRGDAIEIAGVYGTREASQDRLREISGGPDGSIPDEDGVHHYEPWLIPLDVMQRCLPATACIEKLCWRAANDKTVFCVSTEHEIDVPGLAEMKAEVAQQAFEIERLLRLLAEDA